MDVNAILDLLSIAPNLAILVCDRDGCIQGANTAAHAVLRQETGQLAGRPFWDVFHTPTLSGPVSFNRLAEQARDGVSIQLGERNAKSVFVRVREVRGGADLFAVSFQQDIAARPSSPVDNCAAQPDMLLTVAEEIAEFGCFTWDMIVDRLDWSDSLLGIFGVDRSDFSNTGEAFFSRVHPDDQDGVRESLARAMANGGRFESTERIIRPNGEVRWLESLGQLMTDADGKPQQLRGVCRDITHVRKNAQELERQVRALHQLTECAATMASQSRSEDNWATLLMQLGQIVGADALKHCILDDGQLSTNAFEAASDATDTPEPFAVLKDVSDRCLASGRDVYCDVQDSSAASLGRKLCAAGMHSCYAIPLYFDGDCIGTLAYASATEVFSKADRHFLKLVAEVLCAAHTRKQLESRCEREKLRYQDCMQHANMVIWELDPKSDCFTFVSASCEALTGYKPEEWYEPEFWERHLHADDRDACVDFCKNATRNKADHRFEYRMVAKDGRVIWLDDIVQVVLEDGDVVGLRGTLIDITERKSLEQQLLQSQKMEAIGNLTSGIAHDFNNLLTVIVSSGELLQLLPSDILSGDARDLVHAIQDAADRASQLTDQLLLFSRSSIPERQSVDINAVIGESHQFLSRILGNDKQFSVNLKAELPAVRIDPTHLQQIILNLAVNARDAMPNGGHLSIHTHVTNRSRSQVPSHIRTSDMGDWAVLSVSDTGVGIREDLKSRIFDPFFTTKPVGSGTGLGLSVVYGIVHDAGGFIEVDSEVGNGAEFRIYFPAITCDVRSSENELADLVCSQQTVLVVEDDPNVMRVTEKTLQQAGYHVIGIADSVEAQRFVANSRQPIHLMVTDVSMPKLSGPDLVKAIQGDSNTLPFPVLFISGNDLHVLETKHGITSDAENFIQKPFRISTLIKKAQQLISSHIER